MTEKNFKAMIVEETADKKYTRKIGVKTIDQLPEGDVLIRVRYSSLNYKDALSATGNKGVTRKFPHTPGIDAAGIVEESRSGAIKAGDEVIVTSYDLGMNTSGGFGEFIRVPADWVVKLPSGMSLRDSMIFGTAGFTAGMSVHKLREYGVMPEKGDILVTGATGGVGSMAVAILSKIGYSVVGVTGKADQKAFLTDIGAKEIITREDAQDTSGKPLLKPRWAGVVDTVGGDILGAAIKSTMSDGVVTCCGLVASPNFDITVFPFILRGISLVGIDSQNYPAGPRKQIWDHLAKDWKPDHLERITSEVPLDELDPNIDKILKGLVKGRLVVKVS